MTRSPTGGRELASRLPGIGHPEAGPSPFLLDSLLALAVFAAFLAEGLPSDELEGSTALNVLVFAAMSLPVAWRRVYPIAVAVVVFAAAVAGTIWLTDVSTMVATVSLLVIPAYSVGSSLDGGRAVAGLGICLAGALALSVAGGVAEDAIFTITFATVCWLGGRTLRSRGRLVAELRAKAERLEDERRERARLAVADERARIARELHDVVAHNVSEMIVQAQAAERLVERDPDLAEQAALSVERTGRDALTEMRRLLDVLRAGDEEPGLAPQPSMSRVDDLVERTRAAGLPVDLRIDGSPGDLPAGVDLAAYRVVQEGLANVLEHSGAARATVVVTYTREAVEVVVSDDGRGPRPTTLTNGNGHGAETRGTGLVSLRERVALYGGELEARPRPDGGWRLRARIPIGSP